MKNHNTAFLYERGPRFPEKIKIYVIASEGELTPVLSGLIELSTEPANDDDAEQYKDLMVVTSQRIEALDGEMSLILLRTYVYHADLFDASGLTRKKPGEKSVFISTGLKISS